MGEAIGQVLPLGVGVVLSPLPMVAVVLMLGTPRGRAIGPAFLLGWVLGLVIVSTVVVLLAGGAGAGGSGDPALWVSLLHGVLGLVLLVLALRTWRGRPQGDGDPDLPAWLQALDSFTPPKAVGMGALLSGVNPKNLMLTISAATTVAQITSDAGARAGALAVYVVIGSLGVLAPILVFFLGGTKAEHVLGGWKEWLARNNAAILVVVLLVLGSKQLGAAISGIF